MGPKKLLKVISNATYCAPRMGSLLVIKVILCTIKKRTWWSMELFHINFVNLSTPQLLTQKVHGCLYEKFHFNFNISFALSFCRSQNVLCRSKFFVPAQKFDCAQCLFKNFCAGTKINFAECKSSFCLAQNVCDCHNMEINFWSGTKNLDQPKTFWDL